MKKEVEWEKDIGQQVRIYRNLNNGLISLQHYIKPRGWILSGHLVNCILENVSFKVYETQRQRVIKKQRKNVHAFAIGRLLGATPDRNIDPPIKLAYNPYKFSYFYNKDTGQRIGTADYLLIKENQVLVSLEATSNEEPSFVQTTLRANAPKFIHES